MTVINNTQTPTEPIIDENEPVVEVTEADDALANNALYQAFMEREGIAPDPDAPTVTDPDEVSEPEDTVLTGSDAGSVVEGSVAPSASTTDADDTDGTAPPLLPPALDVFTPYSYNGHDYAPQEMERLFNAAAWVGQINPTQAAFVDAVLSGDVESAQALMGQVLPGVTAVPSTPTTVDDDYEYADPRLKEELDALRQTVTQTQQLTQSQLQAQQQESHRQAVEKIESGATAFATQYNLSEDDKQELLDQVVNLQVLPGLATQHTPDIAIQKAMEMAYWNTPKYRDAYLAEQAATQRAISQEQVTRKTKASALTSNGGSVPRVAPPTTKLTADERRKAMAAEIAGNINGQ